MSQCLEHGSCTQYLSIFAQQTVQYYDRFFAELKRAMGAEIDILRVGLPVGYGETHYPVGVAQWAFPVEHIHPGFWVNEPEARRHFRAAMKHRYATVAQANAAWDTEFDSFDSVDYPRDATNQRRWLDFINWYHDALTQRTGTLLDVIRKHFPETPININLGFPFEKVNLGQDISGLIKMLAAKNICVRGPTGPQVPFLYTRHVSTAVKHYHPPLFSSEPADGSASRQAIAEALFKDLTTGVASASLLLADPRNPIRLLLGLSLWAESD